ncbi:MAG: hypothetical protein KDE48_23500, partial [Anaerolineales bacterium]|nr:hypothetical protein [Anaerolineales bacterium]
MSTHNRSIWFHLISTLIAFVMILTPIVVAAAPGFVSFPDQEITQELSEHSGLFRTSVMLDKTHNIDRIESFGVLVLENDADSALLLVTSVQLETLARLRFQPKATDALEMLVQRNGKTWLVEDLQPTFQAAYELQQELASLDASDVAGKTAVADNLSAHLQTISVEQQAAIATLVGLDDDQDGLTNTEESWWCTDPSNPNSDGDAANFLDGDEVTALLDFTLPRNVRWGYGPPFGPPNAWPDWNGQDGDPGTAACNDGDFDTIPDLAEVYMVGSQVPEESTDRDKFDDGQELFGVTYCPGAPTSCGHGNYPRIEYWNFIQASMPAWVEPPGDNLFVAAFPIPEVYVVPGSWTVNRVTTITTELGEMTETTNTYETSATRGQSTSIADTVTWNNWEEVSESLETPIESFKNNQSSGDPRLIHAEMRQRIGIGLIGLGAVAWGGCILITGGACALVGGAAIGLFAGGISEINSGTETILELKNDEVQPKATYPIEGLDCSGQRSNSCVNPPNGEESIVLSQEIDYQGLTTSLDGINYSLGQQNQLLAQGLFDISYAISQPRFTETRTNGHSWGGSQTTTQTSYEEHTITEGEAFTTGQNWSTAWAVDSSHAANLTFNYIIQNDGTEYAREINGLIFNIYLGDDPNPIISYPAWEQFPGGKLENVFPDDSHNFASNPVPLTLEQMKRIDMGERLTVVLEDFSYGADELFYQGAVDNGITFFIEDGVEDGDELVDMYVIPTWGVESVQDVLTRYFPADVDTEGNLNSLWTPEFDGINPPTWVEHFLPYVQLF